YNAPGAWVPSHPIEVGQEQKMKGPGSVPPNSLLSRTDTVPEVALNSARLRDQLIANIRLQGLEYRRGEPVWFPSGPLPVVTLEDFFRGNGSNASIAVNLGADHPGVDQFYDVLAGV